MLESSSKPSGAGETGNSYDRPRFESDVRAVVSIRGTSMHASAVILLGIGPMGGNGDLDPVPLDDQLSERLVALLRHNLRPIDWCYRYGPQELAVLLLDAGREQAARVAQRLKRAVESSNAGSEGEDSAAIGLVASAGIACFPESAKDADGLLRLADDALRQARLAGEGKLWMAT